MVVPEPNSAGRPPAAAAWQCFYGSVLESLAVWPEVLPMPAREHHGDPTVRVMQRARRMTWLHARHGLDWSMFESIRMSVRLAEAFAEWTRTEGRTLDDLARGLERVEHEARQPFPASAELRFVDQLLDAAGTTDLHLAEMDLAMEAYTRADEAQRRASSG
jgi:hypothetical protein